MRPRDPGVQRTVTDRRSALFVTTVASTLRAFLVPLSERLRAEGWRVDALASGATTERGLAEAFDALHDASWSRDPFARGNIAGMVRRIRELVTEGGYDVVHVHTPIAAFVTRFALRDVNGPSVIYTAHGFHFYTGQDRVRSALFRAAEQRAARWTDYLVTLNREDFEAARTFRTIAPDRVRLIHGIGVDPDAYAGEHVTEQQRATLRSELDIAEQAVVFTAIAEFGPVKRHSFMLEALARTTDPRIVLVFVGSGPLEGDLRQAAERLEVPQRVRWAGQRDDVPVVLAISDAVMLASEREGLPRSLMEGMAAGLPVIGTATRGIADLGGDGAGWIVAKHDAAALARAMDEAAASPDDRTARGSVALERIRSTYALPHILNAYEDLYAEALSSDL